jgi:hypothetical protein
MRRQDFDVRVFRERVSVFFDAMMMEGRARI